MTKLERKRALVSVLELAAVGSFAILALGCRADAAGDGLAVRPTDGTDFAPGAGPAAFTNWQALPMLVNGRYRMFAGYDRDDDSDYPLIDAGNKDFNNFLAVCDVDLPIALQKSDDSISCAPSLKGYVVAADDHGPGIVSRSLFAVGTVDPLSGANVTFGDERIRIYVDDLNAPIYDGRLADWKSGVALPFTPPLTTWTSGSLVSYVPISYQSKLRILLDNLSLTSAYYHRIDVLSATESSSFVPRVRSAEEVAKSLEAFRAEARGAEGKAPWVGSSFQVPPGAAMDLLDVPGPATLDFLRLTVDTADVADLRNLSIALTWDDQAEPALNLPLAVLFGARQTLANFETMPMAVHVEGDRTELSLALPMPFATHGRATIANYGERTISLRADILGRSGVPAADWGYFHGAWHEQRDGFAADGRYAVADLHGVGKYVGTMMFVQGREDPDTATPSPFNFLEGDDRTIVDGVESRGTGTEDVFDGGWYFIDGRYDRPFTALIAKSSDDASNTGAVTMLRWNVLTNAIPFRDSFRLDFEYGARKPATAINYSSVAFYYLR